MKSYCNLPWIRLKIDADGSFQSCCHQSVFYGNFLKDNITLEEAMKLSLLKDVRVSTLNNSLHYGCDNTKCPIYFTDLSKNEEVSLTTYPQQI